MVNTNYISSIVKILEVPKQKLLNNKILVTQCRAYLPQAKTNKIIELVFWGNLANEISNHYKLNDYILIEGFLSLRNKQNLKRKKITVTVIKVYPIFLSCNRSINKIQN
jgi:single-stranded DNA-binding protein